MRQVLVAAALALCCGCAQTQEREPQFDVVSFEAQAGREVDNDQLVAVLSDPKTQQAVMIVSAGRRESVLEVKMLDRAAHVPGKSLELWAVPRQGGPRSLGVVPQDKGFLKLLAPADQALGDMPLLAVSLEPPGGSTTGAPSGPVFYSGPCVKYL